MLLVDPGSSKPWKRSSVVATTEGANFSVLVHLRRRERISLLSPLNLSFHPGSCTTWSKENPSPVAAIRVPTSLLLSVFFILSYYIFLVLAAKRERGDH